MLPTNVALPATSPSERTGSSTLLRAATRLPGGRSPFTDPDLEEKHQVAASNHESHKPKNSHKHTQVTQPEGEPGMLSKHVQTAQSKLYTSHLQPKGFFFPLEILICQMHSCCNSSTSMGSISEKPQK